MVNSRSTWEVILLLQCWNSARYYILVSLIVLCSVLVPNLRWYVNLHMLMESMNAFTGILCFLVIESWMHFCLKCIIIIIISERKHTHKIYIYIYLWEETWSFLCFFVLACNYFIFNPCFDCLGHIFILLTKSILSLWR